MNVEGDENDYTQQYLAAKDSLDTITAHVSLDGSNPTTSTNIEKKQSTWKERILKFYQDDSLLIEVLLGILVARIYPILGAEYLVPEITAHCIAVVLIFFLSGFALKIGELSSAASNIKFNVFVLVYNFLGISVAVHFIADYFLANEIVSEDLMKGMVICSCLSMPTNMMVVLTVSAKGDEAVALFLATFMNLLGVFVTPLLIFFFLREEADIDFLSTYKAVGVRVLAPVGFGLFLRSRNEDTNAFAEDHKKTLVKIRERLLVYVVYATFCETFMNENDFTRSQFFVMALSQLIILVASMVIAWILLFILFNREPTLRVAGLFGCSTKTAALGIPLISAIYEDSPKLGIYTLPLLIWYLAQLIIGTMLSNRLSRFVDYKQAKYEREREERGYQCGVVGSHIWADTICQGPEPDYH